VNSFGESYLGSISGQDRDIYLLSQNCDWCHEHSYLQVWTSHNIHSALTHCHLCTDSITTQTAPFNTSPHHPQRWSHRHDSSVTSFETSRGTSFHQWVSRSASPSTVGVGPSLGHWSLS
jgi:hypothetical protein